MIVSIFLLVWPLVCLENLPRVVIEDLDVFRSSYDQRSPYCMPRVENEDIEVPQQELMLSVWRQEAVDHLYECNRQRRLRLSPWIDWGPIIHEAEITSAAWNWLAEAEESKSWGSGYVLQCLSELRKLLGPADYYRGRMPTPQIWTRGLSYVPSSEPDP
jgi:hypothetical protein